MRVATQAFQQWQQRNAAGRAGIGVEAGEGEDFADQRFQAVAFLLQARPHAGAFLRRGAFGQGQGDAQARQRRAQLVGNVAQQLALAVDQALQARAHAVEVAGQHAQFVAAAGQVAEGFLLVGGLAEVVHGAAQAVQRAGDVERQQQAEDGQHHQRDAQCAERPEQAAVLPCLHRPGRNPVDEQVGVVALRAGVFLAQLAPGETRHVGALVAAARAVRARQVGAVDQAVAVLVEHLHRQLEVALAFFQHVLRGARALGLVERGPGLG
ncbi:hypothetical protein D9M71_512920 [compost metagenome]